MIKLIEGTSNFWSMDNFPIWAKTYEEFDDYAFDKETKQINNKIDNFNNTLIFHTVELKSGYYQGVQFYVDYKYRVNRNNELYDFETDEDVQEEYDFDGKFNTIVEMQKGYEEEIDVINNWLEHVGKDFGFEKYGVVARFSNGETMYTKLD